MKSREDQIQFSRSHRGTKVEHVLGLNLKQEREGKKPLIVLKAKCWYRPSGHFHKNYNYLVSIICRFTFLII